MEGSFAFRSGRTVQFDFRLVIQEATNVPFECRSLSVAWKKGVKAISTPHVPVHDGRAAWDCALPIRIALSGNSAAPYDGQAQFEAKFCWLQVLDDGDSVLGHAQMNFADFCDGQVHQRALQVWKGGRSNSAAGSIRLRVSIQAVNCPVLSGSSMPAKENSDTAALAKVEAKPARHFLAKQHQSQLSQDASQPLPKMASQSSLPTELPEEEKQEPPPEAGPEKLEIVLDGVGAPSPRGVSKRARLWGSRDGGSTPGRSALPTHEAVSSYATGLHDLGPRLVALCNRQCLASGLSSAEQEDALLIFMAMLRRSREPLASCGLLFSAAPPPWRASPLLQPQALPKAAAVEGVAESGPDASKPSPASSSPPRSAAAEVQKADEAQLEAKEEGAKVDTPAEPKAEVSKAEAAEAKLEAEGQPPDLVPPSLYCTSAHAELADGTSSACARPLYEMLSHLSGIRQLALALAPAASVKVSPALSTAEVAPENSNAAVGAEGRSPSPLSPISLSVAQASAAAAQSFTATPELEALRQPLPTPASPSVQHNRPGAEASITSGGDVEQAAVPVGSMEAALATAVVVAQIVHGVDTASELGQEACNVLSSLLVRLHELSRDRELWIHRFLAARELQYSSILCERALQHDKPSALVSSAV